MLNSADKRVRVMQYVRTSVNDLFRSRSPKKKYRYARNYPKSYTLRKSGCNDFQRTCNVYIEEKAWHEEADCRFLQRLLLYVNEKLV